MERIDRFTAFLTFPALTLAAACGSVIFHFLFGTKWDTAIPLFQILCIRGIGTVFISLYSNFMMALGHGRQLIVVEAVKDATTVIALLATVWSMDLETLVWGQFAATSVTWIAAGIFTMRKTGYSALHLMNDILPFALAAAIGAVAIWAVPVPSGNITHELNITSLIGLCIKCVVGLAAILISLLMMRVPELGEFISRIRRHTA